jgi:hypothetical protein
MSANTLPAGPPALILNGARAWVHADGYEKGNGFPEGPWRKIVYQVPWDESDAFIDALVPGIATTWFPAMPRVIYKPPHRYPGNPNLCCMRASARPMGYAQPDPTKLVKSDIALVYAEYEVPRYDVTGLDSQNSLPGLSRPFPSVRERTYVETEQLAPRSLQLVGGVGPGPNLPADDDATLDKPFVLEYPVTEYTITYFHMPYFYSSVLRGLVNRLNDKFTSRSVEPDSASYDGSRTNTWECVLTVKPFDWNTRWSPEPGAGRRKAVDPEGVAPYEYDDLSPVLIEAGLA